MDGAVHGTANGGQQGMPGMGIPFDFQAQAALLYDDLLVLQLSQPGTQIGGDAMLRAVEIYKSDDPGKVPGAQWDICNGEHQTAAREEALGPGIFLWKGTASVTLRIAKGIGEGEGIAIEDQFPVHPVAHAVNAVPALQEGYELKGPHNVIAKGCKGAKVQSAGYAKTGEIHIQGNAFDRKAVFSNLNRVPISVIVRHREPGMKGLAVGDQLNGAKISLPGFVDGGNDSKRVGIGLAAVIPAAEILAHRGSSCYGLQNRIPQNKVCKRVKICYTLSKAKGEWLHETDAVLSG